MYVFFDYLVTFTKITTFPYSRDAQSLARTRNSSVQSVREAITPLPNANNQMPNNFPRNTLELLRLTVHKIDVFLTFYNLPRNGSVLVKRERLSKFLGLKLI
ncbi:hypothetical protein GLOIN_2v1494318 [Rhizophagus irregularis DAOM 181602=DAOM 197198]|uniref:Uncharacterized protein n=1 Tax=Rhizophagus irregularis (strain DAOM 181602 / DAOM 197198 / MUCL 43194) TaxID=747089 RepID=A0A2P4QYW9_RHIID|nr:hypothetical protein GLOIN_2v1494318 [Rhizophagus irregularis DAOM 181602=DAOM 197198]POG82850.1 hypothetical protein GLOIN_2v1494318 [Rhizophagus irregularis DAOM 181602=DAOM 197198]|eukprot:XP_025189716.1 hypothetical protein GLOIN_2v1494318 [Rhizophagus irregularis DAOM 181602=DAOM 197198]